MAERTYTTTQVENGLAMLNKQMEDKFAIWARLCLDCVKQHVPEGQQRYAERVMGMPLERIRVDVLGLALKGLPEGVPDEEEQEADEGPGYYA